MPVSQRGGEHKTETEIITTAALQWIRIEMVIFFFLLLLLHLLVVVFVWESESARGLLSHSLIYALYFPLFWRCLCRFRLFCHFDDVWPDWMDLTSIQGANQLYENWITQRALWYSFLSNRSKIKRRSISIIWITWNNYFNTVHQTTNLLFHTFMRSIHSLYINEW